MKTASEMASWIAKTIENNSPETAAIIIMEEYNCNPYASHPSPMSAEQVDWRQVIKDRVKHFNSIFHSYEARQLVGALYAIDQLVPPSHFAPSPPAKPMSAEQVEELAERRASEFYDRESDSESVLNENALWQNRRDNFIAGYNAATTPSVKADGWVSVEDGLPECNEKFGDSDYYSCKDENSSGTPFVAWYNNKTNVWKLAHHAVPNISVNVTHYRSL